MNATRPPLALALALALALVSSCAPRATQEPPVQGADFIVEVANQTGTAMNLRFAIGDQVTALGTVDAGQTRRWTIPNRGGDSIRLLATDRDGGHAMEKTLDLDQGSVKRWELK